MKINKTKLNGFLDAIMDTPVFDLHSNKDQIRQIFSDFIEDLYYEIPKEVIDFLELNASDRFLDLIYRETGISDWYIENIPDVLKVRISYLLHSLKLNRTTNNVYKLFHETLEEFYPKLNVYVIEVHSGNRHSETGRHQLEFRLDPVYITDKENIQETVTRADISTKFLMELDHFIDREEKFSNKYPSDYSKQRAINVFPIRTGILHIQNPTGIGVVDDDKFIPLMKVIACSKQQHQVFPWKMGEDQRRQNIPFQDYIKLCHYLKFKEMEFRYKNANWKWSTLPADIYGPRGSDDRYNDFIAAKQHSLQMGVPWLNLYNSASRPYLPLQVWNFTMNQEDLQEAERLAENYKGLKRSGLNNGYDNLEQFKTDWNSLRKHSRNIQNRKVTDITEFRKELAGNYPDNVNDLKLLLLWNFVSSIHGESRANIKYVKNIYITDNKDPFADDGLIPLVLKHQSSPEFFDFVKDYQFYGGTKTNPSTERILFLEYFDYFIKKGQIPLLNNYYRIITTRYHLLKEIEDRTDLARHLEPIVNSSYSEVNKVLNELLNDQNYETFKEIEQFMEYKYKNIIEDIDTLMDAPETEPEDFTVIFLHLWKIIQSEYNQNEENIKFFWNDFFMRLTLGSTFKDFFYDPIVELFLEYWFPAESSVQNKDIQSIIERNKMNSIPMKSSWTNHCTLKKTSTMDILDQQKVTIYRNQYEDQIQSDGTTQTIKLDTQKEEIHDWYWRQPQNQNQNTSINDKTNVNSGGNVQKITSVNQSDSAGVTVLPDTPQDKIINI